MQQLLTIAHTKQTKNIRVLIDSINQYVAKFGTRKKNRGIKNAKKLRKNRKTSLSTCTPNDQRNDWEPKS